MDTKGILTKIEQPRRISMPKSIATDWLAALRSGQYKQCGGALSDGDGFCCLGVLQVVAAGHVSTHEDGHVYGTPPTAWLEQHGIDFDLGEVHSRKNDPVFDVQIGCLVTVASASELNDRGYTFEEIADVLEPLIETY